MIVILWPGQDRCGQCRCVLDKAGYQIEDPQGTRQFVCLSHLMEMLRAERPPGADTGTSAQPEAQEPVPDFDYFALFPYGYLY